MATEVELLEKQVESIAERQDKLEEDTRKELANIRQLIGQQNVDAAVTKTVLEGVKSEMSGLRSDIMTLLTSAITSQGKENSTWVDLATKVLWAVVSASLAVFGFKLFH